MGRRVRIGRLLWGIWGYRVRCSASMASRSCRVLDQKSQMALLRLLCSEERNVAVFNSRPENLGEVDPCTPNELVCPQVFIPHHDGELKVAWHEIEVELVVERRVYSAIISRLGPELLPRILQHHVRVLPRERLRVVQVTPAQH